MKLLVSIHDVTPALAPGVRALWTMCRARGVTPALLVVPNWHGAWPLDEYPSFLAWLRGCARQGAEIFLHGTRHDEPRRGRSLADELRGIAQPQNADEFLALDERAAYARIARGREWLERLGLPPVGFVAPAWLAREECYRAVTRAGLALSEDSESIRLHRRATRLHSPVMRWSARTSMHAVASALVARARRRLDRDSWLVRVALHPSDLDHPATAGSIVDTLEHWLDVRQAYPYSAL